VSVLRSHAARIGEECLWRPGDLVMWDNRCLLHRAIPYDYAAHRRVLRRTTVAGSGPVVGPFSVRAAALP
jgi:Taurine catabolism dioxygenase TauD, TfdA family